MRHWFRKLMPDHAAVSESRWLMPFRSTLLHPRLWHLNRHSAAGGVAVGLFCGLIPGPFQMIGAAVCAVVFRINLPLALATTLYTNPFTIVPLYFAAYWIGKRFIGNSENFIPPPAGDGISLTEWIRLVADWLWHLGSPLVLGLTLLASGLAVLGYLGIRLGWRIYLIRKLARRRQRVARHALNVESK